MKPWRSVCLVVVLAVVGGPVLSAQNSVEFEKSLVITDLSVVEDPSRTTGCGPWTFCALMTSLAGTQDPAVFTRNWINTFSNTQYVEGQTVAGRSCGQDILSKWPKTATGQIDLTRSPFRLLGIVNRFDLEKPSYSVGNTIYIGTAGEGRFVYGLTDQSGNARLFTIILEYSMSLSAASRATWAADWHALNGLSFGTEAYNAKLQTITDRFARTKVKTHVPLAQLRTNDGIDAYTWDFREYYLHTSTGALKMRTLAQTPQKNFNNTATLASWINSNETAILNGTHTITAPLYKGADTSGDNTNNLAMLTAWGTANIGIQNDNARFKLSLGTCTGCHGGEMPHSIAWGRTGGFFHIGPRPKTNHSFLSSFFGAQYEPDAKGVYRVFDERGRRLAHFTNVLKSIGLCTYCQNWTWAGGTNVAIEPYRVH